MDRLACDRMFVAVIERRSLSGAAQKLGVSSGASTPEHYHNRCRNWNGGFLPAAFL